MLMSNFDLGKKKMCSSCHTLKKIKVGRLEIILASRDECPGS